MKKSINVGRRYPEEGETREEMCERCGHVGLDEFDGYYYCQDCGAQAPDMIVTAVQNDFIVSPDGRRRRLYDYSCSSVAAADEDEAHANRLEECWKAVRERYVLGVHEMMQMQTKALVEAYGVDSKVWWAAELIRFKYLTAKGILHDTTILDLQAEADQEDDSVKKRPSKKPKWATTSTTDMDEPESIERACKRRLEKWSKVLPMSTSLVVSFLACHAMKEPILPTDILNWALQGTLPFLDAHVRIESRDKAFSSSSLPSATCPISYIDMFGPCRGLIKSAYELERMAAAIASEIGMYLPPVNFKGIASRFLRQLDIPSDIDSILTYTVGLYELATPPELWLSTHEAALPTRVAVMSLLIAAIAYIYKLSEAPGFWERGLSKSDSHHPSTLVVDKIKTCSGGFLELRLTPEHLLSHLEAMHSKIRFSPEYLKDLSTYRIYTEEMGFAEELVENFLGYYLNKQDPVTGDGEEMRSSNGILLKIPKLRTKEVRNNSSGSNRITEKRVEKRETRTSSPPDQVLKYNPPTSSGHDSTTLQIGKLKAEMEENSFCYVPPSTNHPQRQSYIYHQIGEKGDSIFAAYADYYILLRTCAIVAQVDVRVMHLGVRSLGRRLGAINLGMRCLRGPCS